MKNIHILKTDQPSRLIFNPSHKSFCIQKELNGMYINDGKVSGADFWGLEKALNNGFRPQYMYITSDEKIKEGDWYFDGADLVHKKTKYNDSLVDGNKQAKKIILTTDGDLIKDGIQAIDDEFLEWFVKNPSCESVEIDFSLVSGSFKYKIIIPQEEPKQDWYCPKCQSYVSSESVTFEETHQTCNTSVIIEESKQETLEEAAKNYATDMSGDYYEDLSNSFKKGANYMAEKYGLMEIELNHTKTLLASCEKALEDRDKKAERMHSEEEVLDLLYIRDLYLLNRDKTKELELPTDWFEQFKKK
jgi:hypothetical protein